MSQDRSYEGKIGYYSRISEVIKYTPDTVDSFTDKVKEGEWQDEVSAVRIIEDKKERQSKKAATLSHATISGEFDHKEELGLKWHSGYIAMDLDDLQDVNSIKEKLSEDDYVYSVFLSASGRGLCVIFKIDGNKHRQAFLGLCFYLYDKYGQLAGSCGDVSRARYVSFDPDLYKNRNSKLFNLYPTEKKDEEKQKKKFKADIFVPKDFDQMIEKLALHNIFEKYENWFTGGFALISKFGEGARKYFHILSATSPKYIYEDSEKKFDNLLKSHSESKDKLATMGTIYYWANKYNIQPLSKSTNIAINNSFKFKSAGITAKVAVTKLVEQGADDESAKAIVEQTYTSNVKLPGSSLTDVYEIFLQEQGEWRFNIISYRPEINGEPITDRHVNSFWRQLSKLEPRVTIQKIQSIIGSDFAPKYNPILDFYEKHKDYSCDGAIDQYTDSFTVKEPLLFKKLFKKWYVSIIASSYGKHSPLVLVFAGGQGTGKTRAFRELLPSELSIYFGESRLDAGKDDEILMTQKLILCNDEFGGKSRQEIKRYKEYTSKQIFSLRPPYGHTNVDISRIAMLCGTTNESAILEDPTGNRRILPIEVMEINFDKINKVDRTAMLMEAHKIYVSGEFSTDLNKEDVAELNEKTADFEIQNTEYELINRYFSLPGDGDTADEMTSTDIKMYLEYYALNQKLNPQKIGQQLKKIGFVQKSERIGKKVSRLYRVVKLGVVPIAPIKLTGQ